ncbi:hypothetical protein [Kushneria sp. TE3]|uniref:hypothetical protein n=1 Tax=Kushneria sp. TE3 TaxID=3449832 RepID=UPI003F687BEB
MDTQCSSFSVCGTEAISFPFLSAASDDDGCASQSLDELSCDHDLTLLDMAPHHRVLDMYGSGQRRMHLIANALDERGELVANIMGALSLESAALRQTPDNVTMARLDDDRLSPEEMGSFDRVLLDIPALIGRHLSARQRSERLVSLLLRAISLCRNGGHVVYITHGHLAHDNEMVIDQVINDAHKGVALGDIDLVGVDGRPGNTCCGGQQLDPRIARTLHVAGGMSRDDRYLAILKCGHS